MADASFGSVLGAGALVNQVARELRARTEALFAPSGLTTQQAALLLHASRGLASPNELAAAVGTDTAGTTRLLDRLEAKGLLARTPHPGDRRSVVIELTPHATALLPQLPRVFGRVTAQLLDGFSAAEVSQLAAMMSRMLDNLRDARLEARAESAGPAELG